MTLYVDTVHRKLRASLTGPILGPVKFFINDILELKIGFVEAEVNVTAATLPDSETILRVAIKSRLGPSGVLMAYTKAFDVQGGLATGRLTLIRQAIANFFASNVPAGAGETPMALEMEIAKEDGSYRQTILSVPCLMSREAINEVDVAIDEGQVTDEAGNPLFEEDGVTPIMTEGSE